MPYDTQNIFSKILRGELSVEKVLETEHCLAFKDKFPKAPIHILVIPKGPYKNFHDFCQKATSQERLDFQEAIIKVLKEKNLEEDGYRLITNCGINGCQEVPHYHCHILSGKKIGPLVTKD